MKICGQDFTSAPNPKKPITCAECILDDGTLQIVGFEYFTAFEQFEDFLNRKGPWIAGLDFPFGQSRRLVHNIGWPQEWGGYVDLVGRMSKQEFEDALSVYRKKQPKGDKQHRRTIDIKANSRSPMMLYGVPVGKMFFEGAPRLLKSGVSIRPNHPIRSNRLVVEAYPALVARKWIGGQGYKNDTKKKQTLEQREARRTIVEGLRSARMVECYGFRLKIGEKVGQDLVRDPKGDILDAVLCAVQAGWAYTRRDRNYGIPSACDSLEGWIVDPEMSMPEIIDLAKEMAPVNRGLAEEFVTKLLSLGRTQIDALFERQNYRTIDDSEFVPIVKVVIESFTQVGLDRVGIDQLWHYALEQYDRDCREDEPESTFEENRALMESYLNEWDDS